MKGITSSGYHAANERIVTVRTCTTSRHLSLCCVEIRWTTQSFPSPEDTRTIIYPHVTQGVPFHCYPPAPRPPRLPHPSHNRHVQYPCMRPMALQPSDHPVENSGRVHQGYARGHGQYYKFNGSHQVREGTAWAAVAVPQLPLKHTNKSRNKQ